MRLDANTADVKLQGITVRFGDVVAVNNVDLAIESGEFFTLLGPSGCGKTTLLRSIAGFYRQSEGVIRLGDSVLDDVPAYYRDTGMVFQNYAVFPHLNVWDNVAYGLKSRGIKGEEARERIAQALEMVDLTGYEKRMPKQLSGGQQQRVVIARAVVIRPRVLLMDEPLANLDAKLRVRLRNDLKELQRALGITTIYVTHDQEEALSLSDRIAVMSHGNVLQVGNPQEIYATPASLQVAQFIGEGNFLKGSALGSDVQIDSWKFTGVPQAQNYQGEVWVGIRPQDIEITAGQSGTYSGKILSSMYLGPYLRYEVDCGLSQSITVETLADPTMAVHGTGDQVSLTIPANKVLVFDGSDVEDDAQ